MYQLPYQNSIQLLMIGKKVKINYEVSQFLLHEGPVEEHFIDCNSPCDFSRSCLMRKLEKTLFFKLICTYNKSKRANQYSLWKKGSSMALLESIYLWDTISYHHGRITGNVIQICQCPLYPVLCLDYVLVRFREICMWMIIAQFQQKIRTNYTTWDHW